MTLLHTMIRNPQVPAEGRVFHREAVRGVVARDGKLLMVFSARDGDYKFPGGGVDPGEDHEMALVRELREECGACVTCVREGIGQIIELDTPMEADFDIFRMISSYYLCETASALGEQSLDPYEEDLGFTPVWITPEEALVANRKLMETGTYPRWTPRDSWMLAYLTEKQV